jgi:hypothetical protein
LDLSKFEELALFFTFLLPLVDTFSLFEGFFFFLPDAFLVTKELRVPGLF